MSPKLLNILLILTPVVLYFGYINPAYTGTPGIIFSPQSSIDGLKAQNVQYADTLNQIVLVEDAMGKTFKEYGLLDEEAKKKIKIMLGDSVDEVKLRNEVLTIANKAGVAITALRVEKDPKAPTNKDLGAYIVSFSIRSKYANFKKLMEGYEKNMRLYIPETISINRYEKKDNDPATVNLDDGETLAVLVTFKVFYLK